MKKSLPILATVAVIAAAPIAARAQERLEDGALGAAAGAVVGGPVGAVVGGVVGFNSGPRIATSLGLRDPYICRYNCYNRYGRHYSAYGSRDAYQYPRFHARSHRYGYYYPDYDRHNRYYR